MCRRNKREEFLRNTVDEVTALVQHTADLRDGHTDASMEGKRLTGDG